MELSTGSFQRQLAGERKKTHDALQETQTLREEMGKLSAKLKVEKPAENSCSLAHTQALLLCMLNIY